MSPNVTILTIKEPQNFSFIVILTKEKHYAIFSTVQ